MALATLTPPTGTPITFDMWEGQIMPVGPVPDFFTRIGQTGTGSQIVATRAPASRIIGNCLYASVAQAIATQKAAMQLRGIRVRCDDPSGSNYVLVRDVSAIVRGGSYAAGTVKNMPYRTEVSLILEVQS